jgi:hypothetical protein
MTLKLREGMYAKDRKGRFYGPISFHPKLHFQFKCRENGVSWDGDGGYCLLPNHEKDLITECDKDGNDIIHGILIQELKWKQESPFTPSKPKYNEADVDALIDKLEQFKKHADWQIRFAYEIPMLIERLKLKPPEKEYVIPDWDVGVSADFTRYEGGDGLEYIIVDNVHIPKSIYNAIREATAKVKTP